MFGVGYDPPIFPEKCGIIDSRIHTNQTDKLRLRNKQTTVMYVCFVKSSVA